jgi:hypothetical protein
MTNVVVPSVSAPDQGPLCKYCVETLIHAFLVCDEVKSFSQKKLISLSSKKAAQKETYIFLQDWNTETGQLCHFA